MQKIGILLVAVAAVCGALVLVASSADAAPAFVLNSGRDGLTCTLSGTFSGTGDATFVANSGGNINFRCNGSINEAPPAKALRLPATGPFGTTCLLVITPSGKFNATCH